MKNSFGNSVSITIFGESHGGAIGAVLDGLAPGIEVDEEFIFSQLQKRKGQNNISTSRRESDGCKILSGVFQGKTTGTPILFLIENENQHSKDYQKLKYLPRPSHADYTAWCKYHGFQDYRGGGHFSGRITAGLVASGSICLTALKSKGINIGAHIVTCGNVSDRKFENFETDFETLQAVQFPMLDEKSALQATNLIKEAKSCGDSIGGAIECAVTNVPAGIGEPWFDTIEGVLSHALFSIPAVKGVEFGSGFDFSKMYGSNANDDFYYQNGKIKTYSNNNGGINGGISNSMPIVFSVAVKPTPSIYKSQRTVNLNSNQNENLIIEGRHDPAIVHRAVVVVQSVAAIVLCDLISQHFGTDFFAG